MPGRLAIALLALLAAASLALSACGGGDDGGNDEDATELLDKAFSNSIGTADVTLDIELEIEGVEQLSDPIKLKLTGPYESKGEEIPAFDWDISATFGGQTGALKVISTGENAFVGFQGTNYEIGEEAIAEANQQATQNEGQDQPFAGLNPRDWIRDASTEDDEDVAGVETTRVNGSFDVRAFLADLNEVAGRAGDQFGGAPPAQLSDEQLDRFAEAVNDPSFDVYVGKDDEKLHRLSTDVEFDVPEDQRAGVGGASGGRISLSIEFANIGKPVEITAPTGARPISELTDQLEGLGGLGGLGGGAAPEGGETPPPSGDSGEAPPEGGGTTPGGDAFEQYGDCLENADPGDTEAIQECAELLR